MQQDKKRVYILARDLKVETKDLLDLCKQAGFDVRNQLSTLDQDQCDLLEQMIKKGSQAVQTAKSATAVLPAVEKAVRTLPPTRRTAPAVAPAKEPHSAPAALAEPAPLAAALPSEPVAPAAAPRVVEPVAPVSAPAPQPPPASLPAAAKHVEARPGEGRPPESRPAEPRPPEVRPAEVKAEPKPPPSMGSKVPTIAPSGGARPAGPGGRTGSRPTPAISRLPTMRAGLSPRPSPLAPLKPLKPKKDEPAVLKPKATLTPEQLKDKRVLRPEDLLKPQQPAPEAFVEGEGDEDDKTKGGASKKLASIPGRDRRKHERNQRAAKRASEVEIRRNRVIDPEDDRSGAQRLIHRKKIRPGTLPPKGNAVVEFPITVRSLSEALGVRSGELLFKMRDHGASTNVTINSIVEQSMAELLAVDYGVELDFKKPPDPEDELIRSFEEPDNADDVKPRAPVVTIMGHVDHGKTSLLDKIRESNVVATEAGGITQVIRAWSVEHNGKKITFLDTPGHEAFTKMRARGAQVTDIAVIVVAADDGVMPQTEEAINHAKAAGVSLVVAINKVDLPSANLNRTRQQLYGFNVLPDNMGGDSPFVETSAATGKGIDDLLEQLSLVAELKELKANANKPGRGTCLEAALSEGEGVRATLLIRDGTVRRGDVILCGAAFGRIRQMYDDLGRPIEEAGPSTPIRITGLDEVPEADDPFSILPELTVARDIAERRKIRRQETTLHKRTPMTLETLTQVKIAELKIILKADFRGSVEAIRKELEKLKHDEVRVRVLEAGIGAITETDVWLALASPLDTMIVGFNTVPDDRALSLAEEKGVQIREYDIIYNLTNDIRAALEGKLKPREEVVHLGRALVRQTYKISRVGTIAGCYITQGAIRRNAKVRVIREGVVIYPPTDRSAGLDSLKRFKEDVAEVREGFECGMKVAGYDDIKVGDVIEAFKVEQVQRTLE